MSLAGGNQGWTGLRGLFARGNVLDALGAAILLGVLGAVDGWGARLAELPTLLARRHSGAGGRHRAPHHAPRAWQQRHAAEPGHGPETWRAGVCRHGMEATALTVEPAAHTWTW